MSVLGRMIHKHYQIPVFALDARSHGKSGHSNVHTYLSQSEDLLNFFEHQNLSQAILIGHSMGGKTAQVFSLQHPNRVKTFISLDQAPSRYNHSWDRFFSVLQLNLSQFATRQALDQKARDFVPDDGERIYLLSNLIGSSPPFHWRLNVSGLHSQQSEVFDFPSLSSTFNEPVLFLAASKSHRMNPEHSERIPHFFPAAEIQKIEGGHFFHAEQPTLTFSIFKNFFSKFSFL